LLDVGCRAEGVAGRKIGKISKFQHGAANIENLCLFLPNSGPTMPVVVFL
jgi:hypothetical protein